MAKEGFLKSLQRQIPALLCFEHLYSEYSSLKSEKDIKISDADEEFIETLYKNRESTSPTWHDLYRFELILANHIPIGKLRGKVVRLRYDYRSVAGQKEFDDYMASKPPDLQSPPDPADPPDKHVNYENLVREDLKDLLDRLYMRYAILPVKEKKLNKLTAIAAGLCLVSLITLLTVAALLSAFPGWFDLNNIAAPSSLSGAAETAQKTYDISSLTILVVVVTGAMGGFVSALQRIQSQPAEGDSVYNLSLLFYGSYSVFVAPITGAIFAILLYLMFTSQVLAGTFFPVIYTPPAVTTQNSETEQDKNASNTKPTEPKTTPLPANLNAGQSNVSQTPTTFRYNFQTQADNANVNAATPAPSVAPTVKSTPSITSTPKSTPSVTPTVKPTAVPAPEKSLKIIEFLANSGPASGRDYALLILWCFIAGFAERFVPDALDRFISKNKSGDGSKA